MKEVQRNGKTYYAFEDREARDRFERAIFAADNARERLEDLLMAYFEASTKLTQQAAEAWDTVKEDLPPDVQEKDFDYNAVTKLLGVRED